MIPLPLSLSRCCAEVDDLLSEYLDGELPVRAAAEVEVHLATCPGCARFAEELAATITALHRLRQAGPVEDRPGAPPGAAAHH
jgi:anti-sigma factor RsiW